MKVEGIGNRIAYIRGDISVPKFAEMNGVHKSTVIRYEREESYPDARFIVDLCKKFDINPNWLLTGDGPKNSFPVPMGFSSAMNELREKVSRARQQVWSHDFLTYLGHHAGREFVFKYKPLGTEQLDDFSAGKYMPTNEELEDLCKLANFDLDLVKNERDPANQNDNRSLMQSVVISKGIVTDSGILKKVLETIDELSKEFDIKLSFEKNAELAALLYDDVIGARVSEGELRERAVRVFKLVS